MAAEPVAEAGGRLEIQSRDSNIAPEAMGMNLVPCTGALQARPVTFTATRGPAAGGAAGKSPARPDRHRLLRP